MTGFLLPIGTMLCIYGILVISANLTVGMANLLTLCQAAFYAIGAYVGTFFLLQLHLPLILAAPLVMAVTGISSLLISFGAARLKGDYFVLGTLGFQMIVYSILLNWEKVTGGTHGLDRIPSVRFPASWHITPGSTPFEFVYFFIALCALLLTLLVFARLQRAPFGRMLRSVRSDELSAQALGRDTAAVKTKAFFISSAFAGLAGILYASYHGAISPESFTLEASLFFITALFIGGTGRRVTGPLAGAALVVILPELLRQVGLPRDVAQYLRQVIYGLVLIVLMFYRPQGLLGDTDTK